MLEEVFASAKRRKRPAFIAFLVAGDPSLAETSDMISALADSEVDLLELGMPFSDPIADGPTIAAAGSRALARHIQLGDLLTLASDQSRLPVAIFSYFNPILHYGVTRFSRDAAAAHVRAVIVPDLSLESSVSFRNTFQGVGIAVPLFVAPTTAPERLPKIAAAATGFVYVVARLGVTGTERAIETDQLAARAATLRKLTPLPLAVGFGVGSREEFAALERFADGIVVGSALIDAYVASDGDPSGAVIQKIRALRAAPDVMAVERSDSEKGAYVKML